MKIALCYSGKYSESGWAFINHLLALGFSEGVEIDVFAHFWKPRCCWREPCAFHKKHPWPSLDVPSEERHKKKLLEKVIGKAEHVPLDQFTLDNLKVKSIAYDIEKGDRFLKEILWKNSDPEQGKNILPSKRRRAGEKTGPRMWAHNSNEMVGEKMKESWIYRGLSMFYSIGKSIDLALEAERKEGFKYDFIFRLRMDMVFLGRGGRDLNKCDGSKLNTAPYYWEDVKQRPRKEDRWNNFRGDEVETGCPDAVDDIFAFGNGEVMKKYGGVYSNYQNLVLKSPTCQECLLGLHAKESGLEVEKQRWAVALYRKDNSSGFLPIEMVSDYGFNLDDENCVALLR